MYHRKLNQSRPSLRAKRSNLPAVANEIASSLMLLAMTVLFCFVFNSCTKLENLGNDIKLYSLFSENAVLQRDKAIKVFGQGPANTSITVKLHKNKAVTQSDASGNWLVELKPMPAGGPYKLIASSKGQRKIIDNVFVGDVWFALGQSNMRWPVGMAAKRNDNVLSANQYNAVKFFKIQTVPADKPQADFDKQRWVSTSRDNVTSFSAVAYSFARQVYDKYKVPVGIIQAAWDNTMIQYWMSKESLLKFDQFKNIVSDLQVPKQYRFFDWLSLADYDISKIDNLILDFPNSKLNISLWFNNSHIKEQVGGNFIIPQKVLKAKNLVRIRFRPQGVSEAAIDDFVSQLNQTVANFSQGTETLSGWKDLTRLEQEYPEVLYNALVHPVIPYSLKGFLWYQGESNLARGVDEYRDLFTEMVSDWRQRWQEADLPVYSVQLASFNSHYKDDRLSAFRQMQYELSKSIDHHHVASAIDLGDLSGDIHPKNKDEVGRRLFLLADKYSYGKKEVRADYPYIEKLDRDDKLKIYIFNDGEKLVNKCSDGLVSGFEINYGTGFRAVEAKLIYNYVEIESPHLADIGAIRYAWSDSPELCIYNSVDLPLLPLEMPI